MGTLEATFLIWQVGTLEARIRGLDERLAAGAEENSRSPPPLEVQLPTELALGTVPGRGAKASPCNSLSSPETDVVRGPVASRAHSPLETQVARELVALLAGGEE